ncbi:MAG: SH3 domain-containing protein [Patescibacteria group bacterium]
MNKKWILVALITLGALAAAFYLFRDRLNPAQAKLEIAQTNVPANVFIDGVEVAQSTPYEEYRKPGEVTLRLVPISPEKPLALWEARVTLTQGITTVVRREFGGTEEDSQGEILSFEKIGGKKAELAVISNPDASQVQYDGDVRGFTPLPINNATVEDHVLTVSHPGYLTREIQGLKPEPGYRLTVIVQLAVDPEEKARKEKEASESAALEEPSQTLIKILETGVGFLRVRSEPSKSGAEVTRVKPGEEFPFIEESKDGDWYKIEYEKGKTGWVSSEYGDKQTH